MPAETPIYRSIALILVLFCCLPLAAQPIDLSTTGVVSPATAHYRVSVDVDEGSNRTTPQEARESTVSQLAANPQSDGRYTLNARRVVTAYLVTAPIVPGPTPDPDPVPDPDPTPDPAPDRDQVGNRITVSNFELIGGWRVPEPFLRFSGLAMDWEGGRIFTGAHAQQNRIIEFSMPPMGQGANLASWPILSDGIRRDSFWGGDKIVGLDYRDGRIWVNPRSNYATGTEQVRLSGRGDDGSIEHISVGLRSAAFGGGFIKGHSKWLIGAGGTQSGGGSVTGPTLATTSGLILLNQDGIGVLNFGTRERRPPNYSVPRDGWVGMNPRDITGDGQLEGAWAADKVYGGGLWSPRGLMYWALLGTGELSYTVQSETGSTGSALDQPWLYTYDPQSFDDVQFERWPGGLPIGHDWTPDGHAVLLIRNAWKSRLSMYTDSPIIAVYRINDTKDQE